MIAGLSEFNQMEIAQGMLNIAEVGIPLSFMPKMIAQKAPISENQLAWTKPSRTDVIYLNKARLGAEFDDFFNRGWLASGGLGGTVTHEIGHNVMTKIWNDNKTISYRGRRVKASEAIRELMPSLTPSSGYARHAKNPWENWAEAFAVAFAPRTNNHPSGALVREFLAEVAPQLRWTKGAR